MKAIIIFILLISYSKNVGQSQQYDQLNRIEGIFHNDSSFTKYVYDKLGNRTQYEINISASQPELNPTDLLITNPTVTPGALVGVEYILNNNGQIGTGVNTSTIYISSTPTLGGAVEIATFSYSSIPGNSETTYNHEVLISPNTPTGTMYILINVDDNDDIDESDETNNLEYITITIEDCDEITITFPEVTNETCGLENGSIICQLSGGTTPYEYIWNTIPIQVGPEADGISAGTYTVTVTDHIGCESSAIQSIINTGEILQSDFSVNFIGLEAGFNTTSMADTYFWIFGDGDTSLLQNPVHAYDEGGEYIVCLTISNACGQDQYCAVISTNGDNCIAPTGLIAQSTSGSTATLVWNNVLDAISYNLQYRIAESNIWTTIYGIGTNSYTLSGLDAMTLYEVQVMSVCTSDQSSFSPSYVFTTQESSSYNTFYKRFDYINGTAFQGISGRLTDGTFIITGDNSINGNQTVILNVDSEGNVLWSKKTHSEAGAQDRPQYIVPTSDGDFLYCSSRSGFDEYSPNEWSTEIIKFNLIGDLEFQKYYEDSGTDRFMANGGHIVEMPNGDFIKFEENGNNSGNGPNQGLCFIRTTFDGVFLSAKTFVHSSKLHVGKLFKTSEDQIIAVGYFYEENDPITSAKPFIIKYNPTNQTIIWSKTINAPEFDQIIDIQETPNGYLFCGVTESFSTGQYLWVLQLDFNGNQIFNKTYEFGSSDGGRQILLSEDGNYIIGGSYRIIKIDTSGSLLWANKFEHPSFTRNRTYHLLENNQIVGVGFSMGSGSNSRDYHMLKLESNGENCITISQNPTITDRIFTISTVNFTTYNPAISTYGLDVLVPFSVMVETDTVCQQLQCNVVGGIYPDSISGCLGQELTVFSTTTGTNNLGWYRALGGTILDTTINYSFIIDTAANFNVYLISGDSVCIDTVICPVTITSSPTFTLDVSHINCNMHSGEATITIDSIIGGAYSINWSNGDTSQTISNLTVGNYSVAISDSLGCTVPEEFIIENQVYNLVVSAEIGHQTCIGSNDGNILLTVSGHTGNINYLWSNNSNQNPLFNTGPGIYSVTVSDEEGCEYIDSYEILPAQTISVNILTTHESAPEAADAEIWAIGSNGTWPYEYAWSNGSNGDTLSGLSEGNYLVTVTDNLGCSAIQECFVFVQIQSDSGVQLFKKEIAGETSDYIQIIDLSAGASIEFHTGQITGGAGTSNPQLMREDLDDVWNEKSYLNAFTFSVTNGQFFDTLLSPSYLTFPVKEGDSIVTEGYGNTSEYVNEKLHLPIWSDNTDVLFYNGEPQSLNFSTAAQGIVGLHREADKNPVDSIGRTFMGVLDKNLDGIYESVVIYTSSAATQEYAVSKMQDFGVPVDKIIMLDGGGSTQMKCNGTDYIDASRLIPQTIVVYAAGEEIFGCRDSLSHNFNPLATNEDGTCETCTDCIQNGDEVGVDCGGENCIPCGQTELDGDLELYWTDASTIMRSIVSTGKREVLFMALSTPAHLVIDEADDHLFFNDLSEGVVRNVSLGSKRVSPEYFSSVCQGMAIESITKKIYWIQGAVLKSANYDGSESINILNSGLLTPKDIKLGTDNQTLYIADVGADDILVYNLETEILDTIILPASTNLRNVIALNNNENILYYVDDGTLHSVDLVNQLNQTHAYIGVVDELEYSSFENRLYFIHSFYNSIRSCNLDGSDIIELATNFPDPRAIAIHQNGMLYISDFPSKGIYSFDPQTMITAQMLNSDFGYVSGIDINPVEEELYVAQAEPLGIYKWNIPNDTSIVLNTMSIGYSSLAYDDQNERVLWCSWGKPFIASVDLDGAGHDTIVQTNIYNEDVEVDYRNSDIYWANRWDKAILRSDVNGLNVDTIVSNNQEPGSICIDTLHNILYWSLRNSSVIYKVSLDNPNLFDVLTCADGKISDIEYCHDDQKLYWSEILTKRIYRSNSDGRNKEIVVETPLSINHFGIRRITSCKIVTTLIDSLPGSLPYVLNCSMAGDTIRFHTTLYMDTIVLVNNHATIDKDLVLMGNRDYDLFIQEMGDNTTVKVNSAINAEITNLNILSNPMISSQGILNQGHLILKDVNIIKTGTGYSILNNGTLEVIGRCNLKED